MKFGINHMNKNGELVILVILFKNLKKVKPKNYMKKDLHLRL